MTKKRIYLDYNATSPLSSNALSFLDSGDFYFSNPSSQHQSGKSLNKKIKESEIFLKDHFNLDDSFYVLFHSGATEGMNSFFHALGENDTFAYCSTDHPLIFSIAKRLEAKGVETIEVPVDEFGRIDSNSAINVLNKRRNKGICWFNFTWMNNETGICWDLKQADEIKNKTGAFIHIDAVQTPGKVEGYRKLLKNLDAYTYSGHKFGALKGCGFSFFKKDKNFSPLVLGGGQQNNLRSGTLNTYGIFSIYSALKDLESTSFEEIKKNKHLIIEALVKNPRIKVIENSSFNTVLFYHELKKADTMFILFDLEGLDVSMGSACSSGSFTKSHVLEAMGMDKFSGNSLRISLGPQSLQKDLISRVKAVLSRL